MTTPKSTYSTIEESNGRIKVTPMQIVQFVSTLVALLASYFSLQTQMQVNSAIQQEQIKAVQSDVRRLERAVDRLNIPGPLFQPDVPLEEAVRPRSRR